MRASVLFVLILLFGCACAKKEGEPRKSYDEATGMVRYDIDDEKMSDAIVEAKKTLPKFIERLPDVRDHAIVKWAAPASKGRTEHIWVGDLTYKDGWFEGTLINKPEWIEGKKEGDLVRFDENAVSDWIIYDKDGTEEGGYTEKVIKNDTGSAQSRGK